MEIVAVHRVFYSFIRPLIRRSIADPCVSPKRILPLIYQFAGTEAKGCRATAK